MIYNYLCRQNSAYMKPYLLITFTLFSLLFAACGKKNDVHLGSKTEAQDEEQPLKGDSTIYGLACEGCTDSVVVLLPQDGSDPVTYNIIAAKRNGKVLGKMKVGDWIGVVLDQHNKRVARLVVDLDELQGIWCYVVMPQLRDSANIEITDSVRNIYFIPREYGFWLKRQWNAQSVGYVSEQTSLEDASPVTYPRLLFYTNWRIWNGKLIVISGDIKMNKDNSNYTIVNPRNDTCDIDYLGNDSLVLSSDGESRSYYRKDNVRDINVKARRIAEQLRQKALAETTK